MQILLTGANGFVGKALLESFCRDGHQVVAAARQPVASVKGARYLPIRDIDDPQAWRRAAHGIDIVVHTAARVHIMRGSGDDLALYRQVNVAGTLTVAREAVAAGVKRFVFISSIKVNGEGTPTGKPFLADETPGPTDAYGVSKLEAEQALTKLASATGMEVVIVRPPLIYGPGVKGNFSALTQLVEAGIPLPLGAVKNKRSFVGIDNLVSLITRCIEHPAAANQVFLASDGQDLSTAELLKKLAKARGLPCRLISVPTGLLQVGATLVGKTALAQRLLGSLQADITKTRKLLDWEPPYTIDQGLRRCFETRMPEREQQ
ncbi:UDP-glucose 4-epimerase family protein [Stutzerimonas stutzeri]|uniref:UDP-glucose 4-epimerase family protein n=1 Tax=Stutzerimonas stutzeri TaxID=316 RepID=UPI0016486C39|nr:SDR family oxidoreductase [Stutzerimonas stutzeri]